MSIISAMAPNAHLCDVLLLCRNLGWICARGGFGVGSSASVGRGAAVGP